MISRTWYDWGGITHNRKNLCSKEENHHRILDIVGKGTVTGRPGSSVGQELSLDGQEDEVAPCKLESRH